MKDKPFDLLQVRVLDAQTLEPLYQRPMYLMIFGKRKTKVNTQQAYGDYRHRYDIEPSFRFEKQNLKLNKFQTSDVDHLDNWFCLVYLAQWMLFSISDKVEHCPRKWEKYNNKPKESTKRLSIAQTQRGAEAFFLTFDQKPFLPKSIKNGKGRIAGYSPEKKKRYKVTKKAKKRSP